MPAPAPTDPERRSGHTTAWQIAVPGLVLALLLMGAPLAASAQHRGIDLAAPHPPAPRGFALDLGVRATAPLSLGGMMQLEMPGRVFGRVEIGALPDGVADAYADAATSLGGWDASTGAAVRDALGGAVFFEVALGLRPIPDAGLELSLGYALFWTSGHIDLGGLGGTLETSLHAIHPSIGWRALLSDLAFFRIEAGWLHTLGASAQVNLDQPSYEPAGLEGEIESALLSRGFTPTLALSLGIHLE